MKDSSSQRLSHAQRDALTLALYLLLVLEGELIVTEDSIESSAAVIAVIWGTALGLTLAHIFAFNVVAQLFAEGRATGDTRLVVLHQLASAVCIALLLSVPSLFWEPETALRVDALIVAAAVGITAFLIGLANHGSRIRAAGFAATMLALAIGVILVKAAVSASASP